MDQHSIQSLWIKSNQLQFFYYQIKLLFFYCLKIKNAENLLYKYQNLCETNDPYIFKEKIDIKKLNLKNIEEKILSGKDIIDRDEVYKVKKLDDTFPKKILVDQERLKKWIVFKE